MSKRKKWLIKIVLFLVIFPMFLGGCTYIFFPATFLKLILWQYEQQSGLQEKFTEIDGYPIAYYEGGEGEPLVLVHGFGDSKFTFVRCAKYLTPKYRVILPEVPGHGKTLKDPKRDYSIHSQTEFLHKFLQKIGISQFHLGGNSMGGHITASYALSYPQEVKTILLLNAAGIKVSERPPYSPIEKPVATEEDFDEFMKGLFYTVPYMPGAFKQSMMQGMRENFEWYNQVRAQIRSGQRYLLREVASQITTPTLLLWGDHDQLVIPKVGEVYHEKIPNSKWVLMKNCGHLPQQERPEETAQIILNFLQQQQEQ